MLVSSGSVIRCGEGPPNPAEFLGFSLYPQNRARTPVFMPEADAFKLLTTTGLP